MMEATALQNTNAGALVELRGIEKGFAGRPVLRGVDLQLEPGEILTILGGSGTGKSVLLKLLKLSR